MKNLHAIILGAALVVGGFLIVQTTGTANALSGGPYQLMQHSNTTASVGVFRLNSANGEVSYCFLNRNNTLACSSPVK